MFVGVDDRARPEMHCVLSADTGLGLLYSQRTQECEVHTTFPVLQFLRNLRKRQYSDVCEPYMRAMTSETCTR